VALERRNAGVAMVQVEHGKRAKAERNGRNALYAGEMELTSVSTVKEQAEPE
jgi:hypothetical protein